MELRVIRIEDLRALHARAVAHRGGRRAVRRDSLGPPSNHHAVVFGSGVYDGLWILKRLEPMCRTPVNLVLAHKPCVVS